MAWQEVVLVVDPDEASGRATAARLSDGRRVVHVTTALREAIGLIEQVAPDLVLASLEMPELPGPRIVRMLRERKTGLRVVALTRQPDPAAAVATVRAGGDDYLALPVDPVRLDQAVGRALRDVRTQAELREAQEQVADRYGFRHILSRSPKMHRVFDQIRAVAPTDATVLVLGETGTGKELVARAIHDGSPRKEARYLGVNCGAFAEGLLESELFGHERGSFTGAVERRTGVFELADGGTLFLDELGQTTASVQVGLLRVLEDMRFRRVGGEREVSVDVRIVAATNTDLTEAVRTGAFREDLFYRLNVFPIRLPPLRERREDIAILLQHFLKGAAKEYGLTAPRIAADAMEWIRGYHWPGNVRQLRAMCERWVIVAQGGTLVKEMLPADLVGAGARMEVEPGAGLDPERPMLPQLERRQLQLERAYLHQLLQRFEGRLGDAAAHAGISRRTLYTKMKEHGLQAEAYRRV
ncbi:MAG: sigma-54-dependent Fis family transcriptional regulator [Alphaproteobacteria bacterium]|nr:sigma-54-dependent Fis family transcriptional regulator [Alphaproteobacteria bacterium]